MAKVKVQHEGKEIGVDLPAGFLSPEDAKATMIPKAAVEDIVSDRLARHTKSVKKDLLQDEAFRTEALAAWDIKPGESGKGKATPAEIDAALKELERTQLIPLRQENETLKGRVTGLTRSQLHAQIVQHAIDAGVKKPHLKPLPGTKEPAIVGIVERNFAFDEKTGEWLLRGSDGTSFALSGESGAPHPYKGVKHFFADFAKDPDFRDYFDPAQKGAEVKGGGGGSGGRLTVSRSDPRAMGANAEKIIKGEVDVVD